MALVDIHEVSLLPARQERLRGCRIDFPKVPSHADIHAISVRGWAVGRDVAIAAIEFASDGRIILKVPLYQNRSDVAKALNLPEGEKSGFETSVSVLGLPANFQIMVWALMEDGSRIPIGLIRGRRQLLCSKRLPRLQPLMVTTSGRTGSTWLMRLLGEHPRIVTYQPFRHEPRVASYWMEVLKTLSEPTSYLQSIAPELNGEHWWLGTKRTTPLPELAEPPINEWLGRDRVETLKDFCQEGIELFYEQVGITQSLERPEYFSEKFTPNPFLAAMMWELYPQGREVFLVRDFRDVLCSVASFKKKYAYAQFYHDQGRSKEALITPIRKEALVLLNGWKQRREKVHLVRYEDLIQKPRETLRELLAYVNTDVATVTIDGMLKRAAELSPEAQKGHQTSSSPEASIGRWRHDLDSSMQAASNEALGEVLQQFGYTV